jgi:hypothetical protein
VAGEGGWLMTKSANNESFINPVESLKNLTEGGIR